MRLQLCEFKKHGSWQRGFAHLVEFNKKESIIEIMDGNGVWLSPLDRSIDKTVGIFLKAGPLSYIDMADGNSVNI